MNVSEIRIHPLKSAAAVLLDDVRVDTFGPLHDRRWMAVDEDDVFLSQRNVATLATVRTALEPAPGNGADHASLVLRKEGLAPFRVPPGGQRRTVRVWDDTVEATDCGSDAAAWITAALERPARIVHLPADGERGIPAPYGRPDDRVSFADALPWLLLTRASLEDLNGRLDRPVPVERFRPNLVIDGAEAFAEDTWRRIRVGEVELDVVKPCARCLVTTTDQRTGERGKEPLRTLATYRRRDGHVWFAQNAIHRSGGTIRVGDPVEVLETGPAQQFE